MNKRVLYKFIPTPEMEFSDSNKNLEISNLELEDLLLLKGQYSYINWCVEHAIDVSKILTGGINLAGFWIFSKKEDIKLGTKCMNLLFSLIKKCQENIENSLILLSIFPEMLKNNTILPEIYLKDPNISLNSPETLKKISKPQFIEKIGQICEIYTNFPINIHAPFPILSKENPNLENFISKIVEKFGEYIKNLRFTIDGKLFDENEKIGIFSKENVFFNLLKK